MNRERRAARIEHKALIARHKKRTTIKRVVGVILALAVFGGCNYAVLVIAANSASKEVNQWVKSYLISFAQDMLTTELIKVLLNVIFIRALTRGARGLSYKVMKLISAPLIIRALAMKNISR